MTPPAHRIAAAAAGLALAALALGGCGLQVSSPDLFVLTRTGQGRALTLLVNDGGTVRCNGDPPTQLGDPLLLAARDLAEQLNKDVQAKLSLPRDPRSVFSYTVRLSGGTLTFQDTDAARRRELASAESFALRAAARACGAG